jgi:uncharacterized membrane protein YfcA
VEPLVVVAVAGVALGGLAQSVTGLGFALVAAPALIAVLGPRQGVGVVVLLGTLASVLPLMSHWRRVRVRDTATLLVPTLLATPVVAALLRGMDTATVAVAAGVAVLVGVAALWRGFTWDRLVSVPGAVVTGITSAALNVIGGVGGPPVGLYAANAGWDPPESRASLQAFFLVQGIATVAVVGLTWPDAWMIGALIVGTLMGMSLAPRIPEHAARLAVLGVAAFGGVALIVGNL